MKTWYLNFIDTLKNSFWFLPLFLMTIASILALSLVALDWIIASDVATNLKWIKTTPSSARAMLSTLAGALVTVTGVVFSITMLTLAQTSAQFGSRLLRTYLDENVMQMTLGLFMSTSLFCFIVLRNIREQSAASDGYVPHIAVAAALATGLVSLLVFIYFVHHVSQSIQAQNVVRTVSLELDDAIERLFPDSLGEYADEMTKYESDIAFDETAGIATVQSTKKGYLQAINTELLMAFAQDKELVLRLNYRPGDFIYLGSTLLEVIKGEPPEEDSVQAMVNDCFIVGVRRTPRQDLGCPISELTEVAVRALSPGINDPTTAITCIDYLSSSLRQLATRKIPAPERADKNGDLRIVAKAETFRSTLNDAFTQIAHYGQKDYAVLSRLIHALLQIAEAAERQDDKAAIEEHAESVMSYTENSKLKTPYLVDMIDTLERIRRALK